MKIAVFAAFPQELKHFRKNCTPLRSALYPFRIHINRHLPCDLIVIETGMSEMNLTTAFNYVVSTYRPDVILSIGFAGALYYRADIGELVSASRYFFFTREGAVELRPLALWNPKFKRSLINETIATALHQKTGVKQGTFFTLSEWMAKSEVKALVPDNVSCPVCERESIHLAKMAYRNDLPFFAIRSITDQLDRDIPKELFSVTDEDGRYRLTRALGILVSRPSLINDCIKLGRNAALASKNLWKAVEGLTEVLAERSRYALPGKAGYRLRPLPTNSITKTDFG